MCCGVTTPAAAPRRLLLSQLRQQAPCRRSSSVATDAVGTSTIQKVSSVVGRHAAMLLAPMLDVHAADLAAPRRTSCTDSDAELDALYDGLDEQLFFSKGGFVIPPRETRAIDASGGSAAYGEVSAAGLDVLRWHLGLEDDSVFVDLGCGRGRALLQVALHGPVSRCVGLELSESRLEQAATALSTLREQGADLAPVRLVRADLAQADLDVGSHFYLCSTAFGAGLCRSIAQRLAAAPRFRVLATSRPLPRQPHLTLLGVVSCGYSYSAHGSAYIYARSRAAAPPAVLARLWCADGACWLPSMNEAPLLGLCADAPLDAPPRPLVMLPSTSGSARAGPGNDTGKDSDQGGATSGN